MNFERSDFVSTGIREHQEQLAKQAAELRLVRGERRRQPAFWRRRPDPDWPDAA